MSFSQEVFNQISSVPEFRDLDTVRDIVPAAMLGAASIYGGYRFVTDHLRSPRTDGGLAGADVVALEAAATETPQKLSHMRKILAVGAASVALGAMAGEALEPTVSIKTVDPNATTALVVDGSYSMRYTADMDDDETRLGAAFDGLYGSLDAVPDDANPAVLMVSNEPTLLAPAGVTDKELRNRLDTDEVIISDKANVAPAIELATGLQDSGPDATLSQIIITDGTISDKEATLASLGARDDRQTTIILTGTAEGQYNLSGVQGAEVKSPVNEAFLSLDEAEDITVTRATSATEIENIIEETITNTSVDIKQERYEGFRYLAGAAIAVAGLKLVFGKNRPLRRGSINWRKKES